MSTRDSIFYRRHVHVYREMTTGWVRLALGRWLDVGLYKSLRGVRWPRWLGRLACRLDRHDWFLHTLGFVSGEKTSYRCLRCGIVR